MKKILEAVQWREIKEPGTRIIMTKASLKIESQQIHDRKASMTVRKQMLVELMGTLYGDLQTLARAGDLDGIQEWLGVDGA